MVNNFILDRTKEEMIRIIEELSLEEIEKAQVSLTSCFKFLNSLKSLPFEISIPERLLQNENNQNHENDEPEKDGVNPNIIVASFNRRIRGGVINTPEGEIYLSEKIVRTKGIVNGDLIRAIKTSKTNSIGQTYYEFEIEEKIGKKLEARVQIPYCIVNYDETKNQYKVSKTANGEDVLVDGEPVVLPENEVASSGITDLDVVDLAYHINNTSHVKVVWKHDTSDLHENQIQAIIHKKKKDQVIKKEVEQTLESKIILMIGLEPEKASFKAEVEKRGGSLLWASGKESESSLIGMISKADIVMLMIGHIGHRATAFTVDYCKRNQIPFINMHTFGKSRFINELNSFFSRNKRNIK